MHGGLADRVDHLRQLRALQDETKGFVGFVQTWFFMFLLGSLFGKVMEAKLAALGIHTVAELRAFELPALEARHIYRA